MKKTIESALQKAMSYSAYRELHLKNTKEKSTTGANQSEDLIQYTKLNNSRTKRWEKTFNPQLNWNKVADQPKEIWLTLTETWCGDAAQNIPVLQKITDALPNVDTQFVLRDENLELMDAFLTNGGRSIPKTIRLDAETLEVKGTWGPRPQSAAPLLSRFKNDDNYSKDQFSEDVARYYVADNGKSVESEIMEQLQNATTTV